MTSEANFASKADKKEFNSARKYCCTVDGCQTAYKFPTNLSRHLMLKHRCKSDGRRATNSEFALFISKYRECELRRRAKRSSINRKNPNKPLKKRSGGTRYKRSKTLPEDDELAADLCEYTAVVLVPKLEQMDEIEAEDSAGENSHSLSLSVTDDSGQDIQNNLSQTVTPLDEDSDADENFAAVYENDSLLHVSATDGHMTMTASTSDISNSHNWLPPPVVSCHVLLDIIREMPGKSAFEIAEQVQSNLGLSPSDTVHVRTLLSAMLFARRELALDCLTLLPDSSEPEAVVKGKVRYIHTMLHRVLNHPKQKPYEC